MNAVSRKTRKVVREETVGQLLLGGSGNDDGYHDANLDGIPGVDLMPAWQNWPRSCDYDDREEYHRDLERFVSTVIWPNF